MCIPLFRKVPYENIVRRFQCKLGREDIFRPTIENESFREIDNDNGVYHIIKLILKTTLFLCLSTQIHLDFS